MLLRFRMERGELGPERASGNGCGICQVYTRKYVRAWTAGTSYIACGRANQWQLPLTRSFACLPSRLGHHAPLNVDTLPLSVCSGGCDSRCNSGCGCGCGYAERSVVYVVLRGERGGKKGGRKNRKKRNQRKHAPCEGRTAAMTEGNRTERGGGGTGAESSA